MEHYVKEKLGFAVNETKAMLDWLNEKRDRFHELSEYWRTYGDTVGYTDDSDEMATGTVEFLEDIYTEQYEDFDDMTRYWSHFINRFENLVNEIGKKDEKYKDLLTVSFFAGYPYEHSIIFKQYDCLVFERECKKICKFLLNSNHKITAKHDDCLTFNILCSDETDASEFLKKIEMFINGSEDLVEENYKKENNNEN